MNKCACMSVFLPTCMLQCGYACVCVCVKCWWTLAFKRCACRDRRFDWHLTATDWAPGQQYSTCLPAPSLSLSPRSPSRDACCSAPSSPQRVPLPQAGIISSLPFQPLCSDNLHAPHRRHLNSLAVSPRYPPSAPYILQKYTTKHFTRLLMGVWSLKCGEHV